MLQIVKKHFLAVLGTLAILSCMIVTTPAHAAGTAVVDGSHITLAKKIDGTGKLTADGKYEIYPVTGDLEDLNWQVTVGGQVYMYDESSLAKGLPFVNPQDVGRGINCVVVCADAKGNIVGMNPKSKPFYIKTKVIKDVKPPVKHQ